MTRAATHNATVSAADLSVKNFSLVLLWPLRLMPLRSASMWRKLAIFGAVFAVTTLLTFYSMGKSKALSDFLDALSNERMSFGDNPKALGGVWRRGVE